MKNYFEKYLTKRIWKIFSKNLLKIFEKYILHGPAAGGIFLNYEKKLKIIKNIYFENLKKIYFKKLKKK